MRPALLVIGPSRSGSSALTGVLSHLGAGLPAHLLGAGRGNERGHFEPQRLLDLNDEILAAHGLTYWDPLTIPPAWFDSAAAQSFTTRIATIIADEYADAPLPILKDPRLCRLAPLYLHALRQLGRIPFALIPLRHPGEAAASLAGRDNTPPETAELLQIRELLGAEAHTQGLPRTWVRYDSLLTDWRTTITHIATDLRLTWPIPPETAAPAIDAFLTPDLRHAPQAPIGPLALRLWNATITEATIATEFPAIRSILAELDRLSTPWLTTTRTRLATAESTLATRTADVTRLTADVAAREESLAIMRASSSWRITAPLRAIGSLLKKGK